MDYIDWWVNYKPLNAQEYETIQFGKRFKPNVIDYKSVYLSLLPCAEVDYTPRFSSCATNLINEIFSKYVDDDTLVITSTDEHDSVKKAFGLCKNVYQINLREPVKYKQIQEEIRKYKKVFIYIIGTTASGIITPDFLYSNLKQLCNNIPHRIVLDAVQEMFIMPRHYDIFDFIIGTSHSLIEDIDLGIVFCKEDDNIGYIDLDQIGLHLEALSIILERKDKIFLLKNIIDRELELYKGLTLLNTIPSITSYSTTYVFNKSMADQLEKYKIRIEGVGIKDAIIQPRFRASTFIKYIDYLPKGMKMFKYILEQFK